MTKHAAAVQSPAAANELPPERAINSRTGPAPAPKHRPHRGIINAIRKKFWIYLVLTVVAVTAHTASTLAVESSVIAHLARFRDVYIAGCVLGFGVVNVSHLRLARWMLPFAILASYVAIILTIHGDPIYGAMWVLWFLYLGVFYPASKHLENQIDFTRFVSWLIVILLGLLVWLYLFAQERGLDLEWAGERTRFTAGLSNPTLLAKLLVTVYWLSLLNFILTQRKWNLAVAAVAVIGLAAADVRTDIVGVIAGTAIYIMSTRRLGSAKWWVVTAVCSIAALAILGADYAQMNRVSSGRWELWQMLIDQTYASGDPATYVFGTGSSLLGKYHYDNLYLEVLLRYGFVGLTLLLGSIAVLLVRTNGQATRATSRRERQLASWSNSVVVAMSLSGLFLMVFPSLGNSLNVILLALAIGISHHLPTRHLRSQPAVATRQ